MPVAGPDRPRLIGRPKQQRPLGRIFEAPAAPDLTHRLLRRKVRTSSVPAAAPKRRTMTRRDHPFQKGAAGDGTGADAPAILAPVQATANKRR
jgi:hypothetical protein